MSHNIPENLKYTKEHEWALIEEDVATIGITDFAQSSLGDVVFVELPEVGSTIDKDATFGVVESIKSVSDLYSPLSGEITDANQALADEPELLNQDCYSNWIIKIKMADPSQAEALLSASDYQALCEENS